LTRRGRNRYPPMERNPVQVERNPYTGIEKNPVQIERNPITIERNPITMERNPYLSEEELAKHIAKLRLRRPPIKSI
jgi:hypothetical protein